MDFRGILGTDTGTGKLNVNVVEKNLGIVDDFVDAFNKRDWDRVSSLHAESVIHWTPDNTEPLKGRDKVQQLFVGYTGGFPDAHNRKERAFGMGDWVCVEYMFTGTHKGPLTGPDGKQVPGTGRSVRIPWVSLYRMAGGGSPSGNAYWDALGIWKQLGH